MMQIYFSSAENQVRWAWTEGLRTLGQREIAVMVPWPESDPRDRLISDLLRFLENYLTDQPKRILPGQTLRYGWTMLRFVEDERNLSGAGIDALLIEEMQHPFSLNEPSYVPGVAHTISLLQLQHEAMRRNRVTGDSMYPSPSQIAIICTRVTPETVQRLRPLMAHRAWQPDARESGWFIGCCDRKHNHDDPDELATVHLLHLVKQFPGLFPYVAMPVGYQLLFEKSQAVIFHPGEEHGQVDPESLWEGKQFLSS
jgi:hypothetical protein